MPFRSEMRSQSQAAAGGVVVVGVAGPGVGGAGAVAGHHRPRSPPGQAHQVDLGAALGKPLVSEGVAELVGLRQVEAGATCEESPYNASSPALRAAACGGRPRPAEPATTKAGYDAALNRPES